ncbi:MAG: threonylcarbamoyladenosine tRNA methylthiotransferase MtaB [Clostridiales bacterium]|nr:threonylcarbamoyladenosine tRNA methylthiotransferase MtaB [Clostridiales bacterium]
MKLVAFLTLGCKVNFYETSGMEKLFLDAGYEVTDFSQRADVYVINTCTVTNMADRKSRQMIHRAKKMNPEAIVVAVGCYVQAAKDEVEKDEAIDLVLGNNQKAKIVEFVEAYLSDTGREPVIVDMKEYTEFEELAIDHIKEKTRAYIKIQDGCNQFCSYCIIPYVRGRIRSRNEAEILKEVTLLSERGYQEVVLTGIHLSSYGVDLEGIQDFLVKKGEPLLAIIEKISKIEGIERIRLGSLEPRIITEEFVQKLRKIEKVCPHFHLSMQSGCDETLKRMNRRYTAEEYFEKCSILRRYYDFPAITTDVIVGFPSETDDEFNQTKAFVERVAFADLHVFKYSVRKGTRAANMEHPVPEQIKTARSEVLLAAQKSAQKAYQSQFIGALQLVLIEEKIDLIDVNTQEKQAYWVGHTKRYVKVAIPCVSEHEDLSNHMVQVQIKERHPEGILVGTPCETSRSLIIK